MHLLLGLSEGRVGVDEVVDGVLEQLVGAEALAVGEVLDHEVGEAVDVAAGLEHLLDGKVGALHLQHALVQDELLAPHGQHVGLEAVHRGDPG